MSANVDREAVCEAISGNLCRCTGYRPIVEAGQTMFDVDRYDPPPTFASDAIRAQLATIAASPEGNFKQPRSLAALNAILRDHPDAELIAGGTDLMLEVTQRFQAKTVLVDVSHVQEMTECSVDPDGEIALGASLTYHDMEQALQSHLPGLKPLLARLGSPQIRHRGTLGGNIGNASPIADMPPILLALDAELDLGDAAGNLRSVPLTAFYHGYKQTALHSGEYIIRARFAARHADDFQRYIKISKRIEDDISSVMLAARIALRDGKAQSVRIAYGGMAAVPLRVPNAEAALVGHVPGDAAALAAALAEIEQLTPMSDVRASADYRLAMAGNLLRKVWQEAAEHTTTPAGGLADA